MNIFVNAFGRLISKAVFRHIWLDFEIDPVARFARVEIRYFVGVGDNSDRDDVFF